MCRIGRTLFEPGTAAPPRRPPPLHLSDQGGCHLRREAQQIKHCLIFRNECDGQVDISAYEMCSDGQHGSGKHAGQSGFLRSGLLYKNHRAALGLHLPRDWPDAPFVPQPSRTASETCATERELCQRVIVTTAISGHLHHGNAQPRHLVFRHRRPVGSAGTGSAAPAGHRKPARAEELPHLADC